MRPTVLPTACVIEPDAQHAVDEPSVVHGRSAQSADAQSPSVGMTSLVADRLKAGDGVTVASCVELGVAVGGAGGGWTIFG